MSERITRRYFIKTSTIATGALALPALDLRHRHTDPSATKAADRLIERVLPTNANQFVCELIHDVDGKDAFEYEARPSGKIALRGNNALTLAVAFNQYLRHEARLSYDWQAISPLRLTAPLPSPVTKVRRECLARERFFLNYCTYGYSLPYFRWAEWQRLLDWMAMNGINRPLLQAGQEAVWLRVWQAYGMSADAVRGYFSAPAHLPWHRMANLDRWGGPLPLSYIEGQRRLQQKILSRARELGMKPILSGFAGHVPPDLAKLRPQAKISRIKKGWGRLPPEYATWYLDPQDPLFAEVQRKFLREQAALYGTDHFYAADPFNEMEPPSWEPSYLAGVSKAIFDGMLAADPSAHWYQMGWNFFNDKRWDGERLSSMLRAVPKEKMVLLDYICEEDELFRGTENFYGVSFIWNYLGNYGGNTHLLAPLNETSKRIARALKVPNCIGVGSTLEGLNVNSVIYEMVFDQPWYPEGSLDLSAWIRDYAIRRTGQAEQAVIEAWRSLASKVLIQGWVDRQNAMIFQVYPSFKDKDTWTRPSVACALGHLESALLSMLSSADKCRASDGYSFDVVNLTREVLGNYGLEIYRRMLTAYTQKELAQFNLAASTFLEIGHDLDDLLGTRHEFLLGTWLAQARSWGRTPAEADYYETNARQIITCWHRPGGWLTDYASRQWNGLLRNYYLPRWQEFIKMTVASLELDTPFSDQVFASWANDAAVRWLQARGEMYPLRPHADPVATAQRLFEKYRYLSPHSIVGCASAA